jgi:hypothetical protein
MFGILFKVLLDAAILTSIIYSLLGEYAPDFAHVGFVLLGIIVVNAACGFLLAPMGIFVFLPIVIIDGLILMYFCALTIKHAAITLGIFAVYQVLCHVVMQALLG